MDPAFLYGKYMKAVDKKKQRGGQGQQQREKEKKRDREKKTEKENEKLAIDMEALLAEGDTVGLWVLPNNCIVLAPLSQILCAMALPWMCGGRVCWFPVQSYYQHFLIM